MVVGCGFKVGWTRTTTSGTCRGYRYLLDEFLQDLQSGHNIVATVFNERHAMYRPRLPMECFVIGTNDIARETGVSAGEGRRHLLPWLMSAVLAAKANGLAVLDGVWNDFKDAHGFDLEAAQGRSMGFDGKTLIHPTQVEPANRAFAPAPEAIAQAQAIVAAFADPAHAGKGVINLDGRMVELLHLEMAQRLLRMDEVIRARDLSARDHRT